MPVSMTGTIEEVRNYRDQVSKQWDDALERPKSDVETRTVDLTRGFRFGSRAVKLLVSIYSPNYPRQRTLSQASAVPLPP
jgi:hypothetical protein